MAVRSGLRLSPAMASIGVVLGKRAMMFDAGF